MYCLEICNMYYYRHEYTCDIYGLDLYYLSNIYIMVYISYFLIIYMNMY